MGTKAAKQATTTRLSKSRIAAGLQCEKLLWWKVHDPADQDLDQGHANDFRLRRGRLVGEAARRFLPGGVLIDAPRVPFSQRVAATEQAIGAGASSIYEASFFADGVFVSVDILERRRRGWSLIEVKSTLDLQDHHIPDVAVQLFVLERSGINVSRVEVMHLNRDCRYPDLTNLFIRENVTADARNTAKAVPGLIRRFARVLEGKLPKIDTGDHCSSPNLCPFMDRCWPQMSTHHLRTLYRINSKTLTKLIDEGFESIHDLPEDFSTGAIASRQIASVRLGKLVVEEGLAKALRGIQGPIAFLDFETISPAIPAWPGCGPYNQIPVQFSCHVRTNDGIRHHHWLAHGSEDPRPVFARELVSACEGAATILAYNASFEKACIADVWKAVPSLKPELSSVHARIQDLLPIVRNHVYHPDFGGSFSIKNVLPALIPGLNYKDLEIQDGGSAAEILEAVLFDRSLSESERTALRGQLLRYCERDTEAMVRLYERLKELGGVKN